MEGSWRRGIVGALAVTGAALSKLRPAKAGQYPVQGRRFSSKTILFRRSFWQAVLKSWWKLTHINTLGLGF